MAVPASQLRRYKVWMLRKVTPYSRLGNPALASDRAARRRASFARGS